MRRLFPVRVQPGDLSRIHAKNEWIKDATMIAERTQQFHAKQISEMLKLTGAAAPYPGGCRVLDRKERGGVFLVPILSSDDGCDNQWRNLIEKTQSVAYYISDMHLIALRHYAPCSPVWRGLILLHEGSHAHQFLTDQKCMDNAPEEEQRVYTFENRLIEMYYGDAYRQLLDEAIVTLARLHGVISEEMTVQFGALLPYIEKLVTVYGPALSIEETRARHACFVTHAYYSFFDSKCGGRAQSFKRRFAQSVLVPAS